MNEPQPHTDAHRCIAALQASGHTLAVAESLTGGLLAATLVSVPGASTVFRGGVVTYATDTKSSILGVSAARLADTGPVDAIVATQMARGVAHLFRADYGMATTGVAGPDWADGYPPGTVWLALAGHGRAYTWLEHFSGDRQTVRSVTVDTLLTRFCRHYANNG